MNGVVKYSCGPGAYNHMQRYGFIYDIRDEAYGVTTINRVRKFIKTYHNVCAISKGLIFAILKESQGEILGRGFDTNGNSCTLVFINVELFNYRLGIALEEGEITST